MPPPPADVTDPTAPAPPPDWTLITDDITCPRCGYNLRGLPTPRCPECGLALTWPQVLQAAHDRRYWLFEHQWKRRPVRTFLQTLVRITRPTRFWYSIELTDEPNTAPLLITAVLLLCWVSLTPLITPLVDWVLMSTLGAAGQIPPQRLPSISMALQYASRSQAPSWNAWDCLAQPWRLFRLLDSERVLILATIHFLAVLASLHIYRQTLARRRIKPVHLTRVAVYSLASLWICPLVGAFGSVLPLVSLTGIFSPSRYSNFNFLAGVGFSLVALTCLLPPLSLMIALQVYLKLPRGWLLALAAETIAALVTLHALIIIAF